MREITGGSPEEIVPAHQALALYHVMDDADWLDGLRRSGLPDAHVKRVTDLVYETLLAIADYATRWKGPTTSRQAGTEAIRYLDKAISFHAPSRGYYWLLANATLHLGDRARATQIRQTALQTPVHDSAELFYIHRDRTWGTTSVNQGFPVYSSQEFNRALREMIRNDRTYYTALEWIAYSFYQSGRFEEAQVAQYGCLAVKYDYSWNMIRCGLTHIRLGQYDEAIQVYESIIAARPDWEIAYGYLAWFLATSPDDSRRNGNRAVVLAKKACELTDYNNSVMIDSLAAAYAETGDFKAAVNWAEKSLQLATSDAQCAASQKCLDNYRGGKPCALISA